MGSPLELPSSRKRHKQRCLVLAVTLLLLSCRLGSCQLEYARATEEPRVLFGTLQVVIKHDKHGEQQPSMRKLSAQVQGGEQQHHVHKLDYFLRVQSGEMKQLLFPRQPMQMPRTGAYVMVRLGPGSSCNLTQASDVVAAGAGAPGAGAAGAADVAAPPAVDTDGSVLCVASMMAQEAAPRDVFAVGQPQGAYKFRALVMQLQVCGQGPATTPSLLEAALFEGLPDSQPQTVQGAFTSCSYGKADFSKDETNGVQVLAVTVPIPCKGSTPWNLPYDSSTCPYVEWSDVANEYLRGLGIKWDDFKHKLYVVPPGDLCSWGGMGYVGCTKDCRVWVSGDLWQYPTTWMHELGHNLYMNHAGSYQDNGGGALQFVSYKDDSGAMGHCCSMRCFNAPHSYQVGWSNPVAVLHKDNLPAGTWQTHVLPPRQGSSSSDTNMLRVVGDWNGPSAAFNLFLEYRRAQAYDAGLLETVRDKVTLYSTPLGDAMPYTTLEAAIGPNQILRETRLGSQLTVWVGSAVGDAVRVHLCRPETDKETDCDDGKDNDCDGYTDSEDTDCKSGPTTTVGGPSRKLLLPEGGPFDGSARAAWRGNHTNVLEATPPAVLRLH